MVLITLVRWVLKSRQPLVRRAQIIENDLKHESVQGLDLTRFMLRLNGIEKRWPRFAGIVMPYCLRCTNTLTLSGAGCTGCGR
jgi:hypothetical protein